MKLFSIDAKDRIQVGDSTNSQPKKIRLTFCLRTTMGADRRQSSNVAAGRDLERVARCRARPAICVPPDCPVPDLDSTTAPGADGTPA
jgi:hypothetical protein